MENAYYIAVVLFIMLLSSGGASTFVETVAVA